MKRPIDIFLTQQAIHIAKEDSESTVSVVSDDIDVFALLLYFYWSEKLQPTMTMQSPIKGRSCIDIKETSRIHSDIVRSVLALHALTGCDSVAATYGIGKTKAIKVSRQGHALDQLDQSTADFTDVVKQSTDFMAACCGCKAPCSSIHLISMLWITDGKQTKQTSASSHEIWQKEYPMLLNRS